MNNCGGKEVHRGLGDVRGRPRGQEVGHAPMCRRRVEWLVCSVTGPQGTTAERDGVSWLAMQVLDAGELNEDQALPACVAGFGELGQGGDEQFVRLV
jgi:hypothetical protein